MGVYIPAYLRRQLREQFNDCCAYCYTAEYLTVAIFEVEHIVPVVAGGETVLSNLCYSCPACNRYKAARLMVIDPHSNSIVPLFHPQQEPWKAHFAWNEDKTELIGLTPTGRATILALRMNRPQLVRARRMWAKMGEHPPPELP
jgi:hypothetical protein